MLGFGSKKLMASLGVDEAAWERFRLEKAEKHGRVGFNIAITQNWVCYDDGWRKALFPLGEIVSFSKEYREPFYGNATARFYVTLKFRNGSTFDLPCEFRELDKIAALLAERCPQAGKQG